MIDYTLEQLQEWGDKIEDLARKEGLNFYPQKFDIIDYEDMISTQTYIGIPSHYPHWSFGKAYEVTKTLYRYDLQGLPYELVINSNPCLAYLMKIIHCCFKF